MDWAFLDIKNLLNTSEQTRWQSNTDIINIRLRNIHPSCSIRHRHLTGVTSDNFKTDLVIWDFYTTFYLSYCYCNFPRQITPHTTIEILHNVLCCVWHYQSRVMVWSFTSVSHHTTPWSPDISKITNHTPHSLSSNGHHFIMMAVVRSGDHTGR